MIPIRGHTPLLHLKESVGQRQVWKTQYNGRTCVTRVLTHDRLHSDMAATIRSIVLLGQGSSVGLSENVQLTIEGYRVATRLGRRGWSPPARDAASGAAVDLPDDRGSMWPEVLDAGLTADGYVYVTTAWVEGSPLHELGTVPEPVRVPVARAVGLILARLHAANVAYGDLKSENLVLSSDGGISLIDLDTMREVAGPRLAVPTRDLSPSWAAPEQRDERHTYLASDLWAFGRLLRELFPAGLPPAWQELADACWLDDPMERPRTGALVARLHDDAAPLVNWNDEPVNLRAASSASGEAGGDTQRVPEAEGHTQRVAEPTGPFPTSGPRPEPTARPASGRGCLIAAASAVALAVVGCGGLFVWWDARQIADANTAADEAMTALEAYKTRPEVNRDTSQRAAIRAQADAAYDVRHTPHATAVRALALVWEQGWQDANRRWDQGKYDAAIEALDGASDTDPATWMARATVEGGACRLNHGDASSAAHCDRALDAVARLDELLGSGADTGWLRVEKAWTEVLVRGELAEQAVASRSAQAPDRLREVLQACDDAAPDLDYGPVNSIELQQDCLDYAGLSGDWPRFLDGAGALLRKDKTANGKLTRTPTQHVYRAAGADCAELSLTQRGGNWSAKGPAWCTAVGLAARGCVDEARSVIGRSAASSPDAPWASLEAALVGRAQDCLR